VAGIPNRRENKHLAKKRGMVGRKKHSAVRSPAKEEFTRGNPTAGRRGRKNKEGFRLVPISSREASQEQEGCGKGGP